MWQKTRLAITLSLCFALCFPGALLAEQPVGKSMRPVDVKLKQIGTQKFILGTVLGRDGKPLPNQVVTVAGRRTTTKTGKDGNFQLCVEKPGVYTLCVGKTVIPVRAWNAKTAPPKTAARLIVVPSAEVVRGQMPLADFFASDAVIVAGMVAAIVAIPIAIHNSQDDTPASP